MTYFVYILRTSANTLYIGQTSDLEKRIQQHSSKKHGSKYLRMFPSFELVYTENYDTRGDALRREHEIKSYSKTEKENLIKTKKHDFVKIST